MQPIKLEDICEKKSYDSTTGKSLECKIYIN